MIGGQSLSNRRQLVRYNTATQAIEENLSYFPNDIYGYAQGYVQNGNQLYTIQGNDPAIGDFNLVTNAYSPSIANIPFFSTTRFPYYMCLAHAANHLFILGGGGIRMQFSPNIDASTWDNIIPGMNSARGSHSCLVVNEFLYSIAGRDESFSLQSIEKIDTTQNAATWSTLSQSLTAGGQGTRAVVNGQNIYVIGGYNNDYVNTVHTINVNDDSVVLLDERLPFGLYYHACTISNNAIWCAGGLSANGLLDLILKYALLRALSPCLQFA